MRPILLSTAVLVGWLPCSTWGQRPEPRAKTALRGVTGEQWVKGVVESIDEDEMTLVQVLPSGVGKEYKLAPIDMLRRGDVCDIAAPRFSYRWQDVKRGDELEIRWNTDHLDKVAYCTQICIWKRPKGKLPAWQDTKHDQELFGCLLIYNDLDNKEDVSDEDIKKYFPPRPAEDDGSGRGVVYPAHPGGLPKEWQAKLDAIRAKKAKESEKKPDLKAPPPPADKK